MAKSGRGTIGDDSLENWEILGSGGFGWVFKAKHKLLVIEVAIKLLNHDDSSGTSYAALCREADYMEAADQQYVPKVYGMYRGSPPMMGSREMQGIVMELMEGGCLQSFLINKSQSKPPPWSLAFRIAHQVALAMDFLHCKIDLVHMDLKPANILLDADFNAKIADFGLSTVTNSVRSTNRTNKGGTLSYTPPEAFDDTYRRVRSYDVYSYGILLWTILTGESPYPGVGQSLLVFHIPRGGRPDLRKIDVQKAAGLEELVELMQRCWDTEPDKRPSFAECVEVTRGVFSRHKEGISAACNLLKPRPAPGSTNRKAFLKYSSVFTEDEGGDNMMDAVSWTSANQSESSRTSGNQSESSRTSGSQSESSRSTWVTFDDDNDVQKVVAARSVPRPGRTLPAPSHIRLDGQPLLPQQQDAKSSDVIGPPAPLLPPPAAWKHSKSHGAAVERPLVDLTSAVVANSPHLSASVNGQKSLDLCGNSPDGRQPSLLTSALLSDACSVRTDDEDERFPTDRTYFIAMELLTTERTYLKDLEVLTVSFQGAVGKDEAIPESLKNAIFSNIEPLHKFHTSFLREVEQRLAQWKGPSNAHIKGDYQRIGDVMLNLQALKPLTANLQKQSETLVELEKACQGSRRLRGLCRDFELDKLCCHIPLNVFILRPLHRLMHYKLILERLCKHYPPTHVDFRDCRAALADVSEVVGQLQESMIKMEKFQKLLELKKDLIGIDNLVIPGREFIRLGCLSKLCKPVSGKAFTSRMFFLFNDVIVYTSRGVTATNQFKVHGHLPLHGMTIRESEDEWGVPHAFTLVGQQQSVVVAASSLSEMGKWMEDIKMAIHMAESSNGPTSDLMTFPECPEDSSVEAESTPPCGNTMVHVCWHRNTSVSMVDFNTALENQLSGNLLRKFKNSNGWQKHWVVFTNFTLFIYKTYQDDYALAGLPLLGYSVTVPSESENIHEDYVIKLHFKSHVYYFRSESEYTFERWMEVLRSACVSSPPVVPAS